MTIKGDKRVNLQQFREENGTRRLSFASPQDLKEKLGLEPGSVTPLGLLNDSEHQISFTLTHILVNNRELPFIPTTIQLLFG